MQGSNDERRGDTPEAGPGEATEVEALEVDATVVEATVVEATEVDAIEGETIEGETIDGETVPAAGRSDEAGDDAGEESSDGGRGFRVRDRRFWTRKSKGDGDDADARQARAEKPSYVVDLEKKLAEQETRLEQYVRAHRQAQQQFEEAKERLRRDVERQVELGRAALVARFFEVLDNMDRSLEAAEQTSAGPGALEALRDGVRIVHRQLTDVLAALGLERIDPVGEPFDPTFHDAMSLVPVAAPEQANLVQQVFRPGYRQADHVLRPAMVTVGRYSGPAPPTTASSEE